MREIIALFFILATLFCLGQNKVGDKIPPYVFKQILNSDNRPIEVGLVKDGNNLHPLVAVSACDLIVLNF